MAHQEFEPEMELFHRMVRVKEDKLLLIWKLYWFYRASQVVVHLGWVDLDLGCSTTLPGQQVATIAAHQPREFPRSKSTQPRSTAR